MDWGAFLKIWWPVVTALGVGAATLSSASWAVVLYIRQQRENARTRRVEAQKPFLEIQLNLYKETAKVVGLLISLEPSSEEWKAERKRFTALYWSELSMVEHERVEEAMKKFREVLKRFEGDHSARGDLEAHSYHLAHAIRDSIKEAWSGLATPSGEEESGGEDNSRSNKKPEEIKINGSLASDPGKLSI
jgi:hypothetical protein